MVVSLITNPPYNIKWEQPALAGFMSRYAGYELPPESNANYAFILSGLDISDSRSVFLLPCGVLTTSNKAEAKIKKQLLSQNILLAVITLPPDMFESTGIPTCLLVFDAHKDTQKIAMIDLSKKCTEEVRDQRGQFGGESHTKRTYHKTINVIPYDIMEKCVKLIESKEEEEDMCRWVAVDDIARFDYSLTPRRYFEIKTEVKHRPFGDIAADYNRIIEQKNAIKIKMNKTAAKRLGFDCMDKPSIDLSESFAIVGQKPTKENNISFSAEDGIKISISTKDGIHPLVLEFLNHWRQMIIYLNSEENRCLAEFRDALLPELLGGKLGERTEG